eukprot:10871781-Heterocapsa_arctica.AAC.1
MGIHDYGFRAVPGRSRICETMCANFPLHERFTLVPCNLRRCRMIFATLSSAYRHFTHMASH